MVTYVLSYLNPLLLGLFNFRTYVQDNGQICFNMKVVYDFIEADLVFNYNELF